MMIEIAQMALSYYLNKLRKDRFRKHHGRNGPESAARARSAICRTVKAFKWFKAPNASRFSAETCTVSEWELTSLWRVKTFKMIMLFIKLYIYQKILKNKVHHNFHTKYEAAKLFLTLIIRNVSWVKQIVMISIRSCDTENWSNEDNSALHHRNNITFYNILKLKTFFLFVIILHNIAVFFNFILIK